MILLFLVFLCFCAAVDLVIAGEPVPMSKFGHELMSFAYKEETKRDVDKFRVGCYILFCHIDDKDACVHTKKAGCECREECLDFAWLYSRENQRPKTETCTVWKGKQHCVDECVLLLSKGTKSDRICSSLCGYHFSFANREEYQAQVCDTFMKYMPNNLLRLM